MLRLVFKPLLILLTLGSLLVAAVQVAGRVLFNVLDDFEAPLNRVLAERRIQLSGLSGDWRMLNPVLRIERLELPAGHVDDLVVEVDAVESVVRGELLLRRLRIGDAELTLHKAPGEPWRLAGAAAAADFDPLPLLEHSDQLEARGTLRLQRDGLPAARIAVDYLGLNAGGEHRHRLALANEDAECREGAGCALSLDLHSRRALWPLWPETISVRAVADGFVLPRAVAGVSAVRIEALDAGWRADADQSAGFATLRAEQAVAAGRTPLALSLDGVVNGSSRRYQGAVSQLQVTRGADLWELPRLRVEASGEQVWVRLPELDLARGSRFLHQALEGVEPAQRWIEALDISGRARNLRGYLALDDGSFGYAMALDGLSMEGYKGAPTVRGGAGRLIGTGRALQFDVNAENMSLRFPDLFTDTWQMPYAQGRVQAWIGPEYFGLRGLNLRTETLGARAAGGFALSRPPEREGQRLTLLIGTDRIEVDAIRSFVSYKLDDGLRSWLQTAPRSGVLEAATAAYQGQFSEEPGELGRRFELEASVRDGVVNYHPDWPAVTALDGELAVAGPSVEVAVDSAVSADARIDASHVRVVAGGADVSLDAELDSAALLALVRSTPLQQWLEFVEPDWSAQGPLRVSGELSVPFGAADPDTAVDPAVRLRADLEGVDLDLPGYRLELTGLAGSVRYRFPTFVDASGMEGRLFGEPVQIGARTESDGDTVHLRFSGVARPADVWHVTTLDDPGVVAGRFRYDADLGIAVAPGRQTELVVSSDLAGLAVDLPAGLSKAAEAERTTEARLVFGSPAFDLDFVYGDLLGWLEFTDQPLRGALAFGGGRAPGRAAVGASELQLTGRLPEVDLESVVPGGDGESALPLPLRLADLRLGAVGVGGFTVQEARVSGTIADAGLDLQVHSRELEGHISRQGDEPLAIDLDRLQIPAGEVAAADDSAPGADPLDVSMIAAIPAADVRIGELQLGPDDYGAWRFELRPDGDELRIDGLDANVRGVAITSSRSLLWDGAEDRSRFVGTLDGGNLAEALPQWGYAASVETESASLSGEFSWPGSPLAVDLRRLTGAAQALAVDGRFLDVEAGSGSQRIFSLLNFTNIAKRLSLNFSDVFGKGVSFDEIRAHFALDDGLLTFLEPMEVKGTGSRFRVSGSVNLEDGSLDNDMVVTLPVSQSLPWYAAYVALANPLAGLGVLVGERVLRKPLEQVSSAKYHIGGTLDEPELNFVSVFDTGPSTPAAGNGAGEPDTAEDAAAPEGQAAPPDDAAAEQGVQPAGTADVDAAEPPPEPETGSGPAQRKPSEIP